jgi:hypothetical protein
VRARISVVFVVWLSAMIAMSASLACGAHCLKFCAGPASSEILETNGLLVTSFSSTCPSIQLSSGSSSSEISGSLLDHSQTCHVEAALDDGEHFSLDVPFTSFVHDCCCDGTCFQGFAPVWQPIIRNGVFTPDGSPFPVVDAFVE